MCSAYGEYNLQIKLVSTKLFQLNYNNHPTSNVLEDVLKVQVRNHYLKSLDVRIEAISSFFLICLKSFTSVNDL